MASTEERMKILKMIEEGKVSPEDGAKLLAALADGHRPRKRLPEQGQPADGSASRSQIWQLAVPRLPCRSLWV